MSFQKNTSSLSSSSSSSSSDMEESTCSVDSPSPESFDEDDFTSKLKWFLKRDLLLNKISALERRALERQEECQSALERFRNIQISLEREMQKVENSMVTMEQLENLQKTFDEFQADMKHKVSCLQDGFKRMRGVAVKQSADMKVQDKPRTEDLDPKVVESIQSLKCCPTVPKMKANSNAVSEYSSNLIGVLNNIAKSDTCSPAMSWALKITTATIKNLNKAFQDQCNEVKALKKSPQKLVVDISGSSWQENGSVVQQQMPKLLANPKRPETDPASKPLTLPQIRKPVQRTKKVSPLERPVTALQMTPKDLKSPSADDTFPLAPVRSFALPNNTQSIEKTRVCMESEEETGKVTSFNKIAQEELQSPAPLGIYHPSPVKSFDLPQISQSVEKTKVNMESKEETKVTSFNKMAQKELQSPPPLGIHHPSPVISFDLPQISQSVEETKVYVGSTLITGTSFEGMAQKDLLQSVEEREVDVVPMEDRQSPSPVRTHPSSIIKRPQIQTAVKPSLKKPDKPETNKCVSAVSGNNEEDDDKLLPKNMKGQTLVIDIKAQESNLKHLDQAFQHNSISSEMYNQCRGNISQMLQSVDLRLGCLLRRYIRHVQLKQLRNTLDENFKLTRNLNDGLAFKKVHSQLCKFDHFKQSVRKVWDAKQASTDKTRKCCIAQTAHLYQQMNSNHGLHLTGISCVQRHVPVPLLTVTPVRFSTHLCPSPPQRPQTAPSRASPASLPRNNLRVLYSTNATRNISAVEPEDEIYDPLFLPLSELGSKRRDRQFLPILGKVLRLNWLSRKTLEERQSIIQRLMPSFARRCIDNNDFLSLQEILNYMDIDAADYDGNTVLHRACEKGNNDMVLQLLALGASCQMTNRFGSTPLHLAIKNKHDEVIKILMLQNATVTLHPVRIGMELIKAVRAKDYRLVHAWYLAGTNMNQQDYNGQTALHAAVEKRNKFMVSKLLQYGATPQIADVWERTAADEAKENNLHDILELLSHKKSTQIKCI